MDQFLEYLPKLIATVGLLYFAFNPIFRHQNTIGCENLAFIAGGILIAAWYRNTEDLWKPVWVFGGWTVLYLAAKVVLFALKRRGYVLFNLFRNHAGEVETFLKNSAESTGLSAGEWHFSPERPFWVSFQSKEPGKVKKVIKDLETFIQKHVPFSFWNAWAWIIVALTLLASLWRF
jgi:hypothetical protein